MFRVRRFPTADARLRFNALSKLYRKFFAENTSETRGLRLLRDWLSPDQRKQFDKLGYFDVVGCNSRRHYRIYHNVRPPNVYEIDGTGCRKMGLCFAPLGQLVKGDIMLAQKIALETDERTALAAANRVPINRCPY
jgi:hypothetical protein